MQNILLGVLNNDICANMDFDLYDEQNEPHRKGKARFIPNGRRGAARSKRRGSFALCGARLKALP